MIACSVGRRALQLLRGTPTEAVIDEMVLMGFTRADAIEAMTHSVRPGGCYKTGKCDANANVRDPDAAVEERPQDHGRSSSGLAAH